MIYPVMRPTENNTLILEIDYRVKGVLIPKGFESDGLTLKNRGLRLFVNKYAPKFLPFAFVHDYLCEQENYTLADNLGQEVLFEIEESFRTKTMMKLIRLYHWGKYGTES